MYVCTCLCMVSISVEQILINVVAAWTPSLHRNVQGDHHVTVYLTSTSNIVV